MSATEVGEKIEYLHAISGIALPTKPQATVKFVQVKYGAYYKELLQDSFDWFADGHIDKKPYQISAMFIVEIMRKFLVHGNSKRKYYPSFKLHDEFKGRYTDSEASKRAMLITAERYYNSLYSQPVEYHFVLRDLESLAEYIVKNNWVRKEEISEDIRKAIAEKLKNYNSNKYKKHKQDKREKYSLGNLGYNPNKQVDYEKCVVTAYLIEKRIKQGWKPTQE